MCKILSRMVDGDEEDSLSVGAILHGGTIMALLSLYGGIPYFAYQTACGNGYLCRAERWRLVALEEREKVKIEVMRKI